MQSLLEVKSFADAWHQGQWRARGLPEALGAKVEWDQGGRHILGCATTSPDGPEITLNTRIRGTRVERPVVLHECVHVILCDLLGFCGNAWAKRQSERNATYGSALLAIPTDAAIMFVNRRASVYELADYYEVPRAMVHLRGALAILLGEADGEAQRAREVLTASRRSLDAWMARVARAI